MIVVASTVLSALSALLFYAGTPHCRWPALHPLRRAGALLGTLTAIGALWQAIMACGVGVGLCLAMGCWMFTALVLPWLAAWTVPAPAGKAGR